MIEEDVIKMLKSRVDYLMEKRRNLLVSEDYSHDTEIVLIEEIQSIEKKIKLMSKIVSKEKKNADNLINDLWQRKVVIVNDSPSTMAQLLEYLREEYGIIAHSDHREVIFSQNFVYMGEEWELEGASFIVDLENEKRKYVMDFARTVGLRKF